MPDIDLDNLPSYAQLSAREDAPKGSAWGLFGPDDQLGTVNFLTPERVAAAARLVRKGAVFPLNLPLHLPHPPLPPHPPPPPARPAPLQSRPLPAPDPALRAGARSRRPPGQLLPPGLQPVGQPGPRWPSPPWPLQRRPGRGGDGRGGLQERR